MVYKLKTEENFRNIDVLFWSNTSISFFSIKFKYILNYF
jgi:hypothetical protein